MLLAGPALVGQQQRITGTLGAAAGGRPIADPGAGTGAARWATIATVRAAHDGSFATTWRAATDGALERSAR